METSFNFIDNTEREVSIVFQHNGETDPNACRIIAVFSPSGDREPEVVEFSVTSIEQLDDMISALQFIRFKAQKKTDLNKHLK